jgi:transcriptional regulator of acetoin/glycerol metabolism
MALPLQSRLLRVLAEGEVQPVGALVPRKVDLRVVSASHRSLASLVEQGRFREDLYRLNAAALRLPLRERSDFGWILDRLLARHGKERSLAMTATARAYFTPIAGRATSASWTMRFAAALSDSGIIDCDDLPDYLVPCDVVGMTRQRLRAALVACNWNVSEAARRLEVDRTTIHRRIKRLGIARTQLRQHLWRSPQMLPQEALRESPDLQR